MANLKLSLKPTGYLIVNDERTDVTFQYEVSELVNQNTGVYVQQISDYWVIIRVNKPGASHVIGGHYFTADEALSVLQEEQDK